MLVALSVSDKLFLQLPTKVKGLNFISFFESLLL